MALLFEPLLQQTRERQVHVVAAEQDVLADGHALKRELAVLLGDGDQGEVGRAAADVADEDEVADLDPLAPAVALRVEPGVEGGLRLFEQRDVLEPGGLGRSTVSSRATASNEAGTVRSTSCSPNASSGFFFALTRASHA